MKKINLSESYIKKMDKNHVDLLDYTESSDSQEFSQTENENYIYEDKDLFNSFISKNSNKDNKIIKDDILNIDDTVQTPNSNFLNKLNSLFFKDYQSIIKFILNNLNLSFDMNISLSIFKNNIEFSSILDYQ